MSLSTAASLSLSQINSCMRFTNGNVGIGTTAPAYKLDIVGNVNATSLLASGNIVTNTTFNAMTTYNDTATLTATTPSDIEVFGQIGDVTIALPVNNTSGNTITVHNFGERTGIKSSVFVRTGTSTTSGSLARLRPGDSVTTTALQTAGKTPRQYQKTIFRKYGSGVGWGEHVIPNTRNWSSVCWAPELGLFCAVNDNSAAVVMTSPDGITWTERAIPASRVWRSICWAPELGLFCAFNSGSAAVVMTSPDGITWTERAIPASRNWKSVCWAPELGLFCAVNQGSAAFVMTSPDGITWTERAIPNARYWTSICWAPELGLFCAVTYYLGAVVMTSPDGITWTERAIPADRYWWGVCWAPELSLFCAVNQGSAAVVMTSPDGITWTERAIPNNRSLTSVCWAPELGLFCAVNSGSAAVVMTSPDGVSWTERAIPNTRNCLGICWSPELMTFCAVNNGGAAVLTNIPNVLRTVNLNFFPPSNTAQTGQWLGQGDLIMARSLVWAWGRTSGSLRVYCVHTEVASSISDVTSKITSYMSSAFPSISFTFFTDSAGAPTIGTLTKSNYDVAMVFTNNPAGASWGPQLNSFAANKGGIVLCTFANASVSIPNFSYSSYSPIPSPSGNQSLGGNLSVTSISSHFITTGLSTFSAGTSWFGSGNQSLNAGATSIANYSSGTTCIAVQTFL